MAELPHEKPCEECGETHGSFREALACVMGDLLTREEVDIWMDRVVDRLDGVPHSETVKRHPAPEGSELTNE